MLPIASNANDRFESYYAALLQQHVRPGEINGIALNIVDYAGWKADSNHKLAKAALHIPTFQNQENALAFWINLYNFLTIDLIITQDETESIKNLGSWFQSPWKKHDWIIDGARLTLHHIEHEILRPMGEPRIHFAINCASISCPDLRDEIYQPTLLDQQLTHQTVLFLANNQKGLRIDGTRSIIASAIFDWFDDDFGSKKALHEFLQKHAPNVTLQHSITDYLDYNWQLNGQW